MPDFDLFHGDLLTVLPTWEDNCVDAVVCDPPYGLSFMGKNWDHNVPGPAYWREIFRVLKPGGHLLAFGGSRTFHRMFCAIEDAGFEVRDTLMWVYGSGFPKSLDVSKALDKAAGAEREIVGSMADICARYKTPRGKPIHDGGLKSEVAPPITAPATDLAKQWHGWGTALKPSHEPICMARKPLEGTSAQNTAKWGVGGLNIDGCRVASVDGHKTAKMKPTLVRNTPAAFGPNKLMAGKGSPLGRWPANLIHDGSDKVVSLFPTQGVGSAARFFYCAKASPQDRNEGCNGLPLGEGPETGRSKPAPIAKTAGARGAPRENHHPTVKPTDLMRYLCRMVTPPGGTVLDPFMGSGSTGKGALLEGFNFLGIEREKQYIEIATARLNAVLLEEVK